MGDVGAMADNMIALLDNIDFAKKMGSAGKENIRNHFSMARHINSLQHFLENAQ